MESSAYKLIDSVTCLVDLKDTMTVDYDETDQTVWFTINGDQCVNVTGECAKELSQNILNFFNKAEV